MKVEIDNETLDRMVVTGLIECYRTNEQSIENVERKKKPTAVDEDNLEDYYKVRRHCKYMISYFSTPDYRKSMGLDF